MHYGVFDLLDGFVEGVPVFDLRASLMVEVHHTNTHQRIGVHFGDALIVGVNHRLKGKCLLLQLVVEIGNTGPVLLYFWFEFVVHGLLVLHALG